MSAENVVAVFPSAAQFDTQNEILMKMAAKMGAFDEPLTWASFQAMLRAGLIKSVASVGDQVEVNMNATVTATVSGTGVTAATVDKDKFIAAAGESSHIREFTFDGAAWNLDGSAVELADYGLTVTGAPTSGDAVVVHIAVTTVDFDIQGIDEDVPSDYALTHSISLLMHNCLYNMVFDPAQYLYVVDAAAWPDGLPAGTYNITLDHGAYNYSTAQDGTYQFTTTQTIPVGGGIRHTTMGVYRSDLSYTKDNLLAGTFITYAADRITTIESGLVTTEGAEGTNLGTTTAREPQYKVGDYINFTQRQGHGSGRWSTSWLRQVLNSADAEVQFVPGTPWSRPVSGKTEGFLHSLDPALVAVLGKTRRRYALSIADGYGYEDVEDLVTLNTMTDMGFGSSHEIPEGPVDAEGNVVRTGAYSYWDGTTNADKIKLLNGVACNWCLGSIDAMYASVERYVYASGALYGIYANGAIGVVPRLIII